MYGKWITQTGLNLPTAVLAGRFTAGHLPAYKRFIAGGYGKLKGLGSPKEVENNEFNSVSLEARAMSGPSSYTVWLNQEINAGRLSQYNQPESDPKDKCTGNKDCKNPWCLSARARGASYKEIHK